MGTDAGRLLDPALYADGDPFELYAELRRDAPVCWVERVGGGFWAVTTHPEVSALGADPGGFCSSRGILVDEIGTTYDDPPTRCTPIRRGTRDTAGWSNQASSPPWCA